MTRYLPTSLLRPTLLGCLWLASMTSTFASNSSMDPTSSPDLNLQNNSKLVLGVDDLSEAYLPSPKTFLGFTIVCTSSYYFAGFFPSLKLPKITGYLIMGIIAGPFVLNLVPKSEVRSLRAVDETSLAFIAFAAGGKIYLKKMMMTIISLRKTTMIPS